MLLSVEKAGHGLEGPALPFYKKMAFWFAYQYKSIVSYFACLYYIPELKYSKKSRYFGELQIEGAKITSLFSEAAVLPQRETSNIS